MPSRASRDGLGVDVSTLINIDWENPRDLRSFETAEDMPGAFDAVQELVEKRFGEKVFLLMKCDLLTQHSILDWLMDRRFFHSTGVRRHHIKFFRKNRQKFGICHELSIGCLVDKQKEILTSLSKETPERILFDARHHGTQQRIVTSSFPITIVNSWKHVRKTLLGRIQNKD